MNLLIGNFSDHLSLCGVCDLMNWWCLKMYEMHQMLQIAMNKQWFCSPVDQLMTSENVPNAGNAIVRNEKSIMIINGWRLKTYETNKTIQKAMNKQELCSPADQLLRSENVPNTGNAIIRNEKTIMFINWWRLKTYETRKMLQKQRQNKNCAHLLINFWRLKCFKSWKWYYTQWKIYHFHQRMTCKERMKLTKCYKKVWKKYNCANLLFNLWRLNKSQMLEMLLYAMKNQ